MFANDSEKKKMEEMKARIQQRLDELIAMTTPLQIIKQTLIDEFKCEYTIFAVYLSIGNDPVPIVDDGKLGEVRSVYVCARVNNGRHFDVENMRDTCASIYNTHPLYNYPNNEPHNSDDDESDED